MLIYLSRPHDRSLLDEALNFARTLNDRKEDVARIDGGTHPDVLVLPADASSIKIETIRDLTRFTRYGRPIPPHGR